MNTNQEEAQNGQYGQEESGPATRINKYLALCGIESRRTADKLIEEGRVEVNGKVVDAPGMKVTARDFVKVDGKRVQPKEEETVLLNKPRGFVCSREAQGAIGTVYDLMLPRYRHLNYVGRLDADSEGLIVMTNNGDLIQRLSHPSNGIEKEYWVTLDQNFDNSVLMQLLKGLRIPEGQAKAKYVCRLSARRAAVVLEQGLKRQIRQMFACMGLRVKKLVRVRIGSLWGGDLEPGSSRVLEAADLELAMKNPRRQKNFLGTRELNAYKGPVDKKAEVDDAEDHYEFNPDDFEGLDLDQDTYELEEGMKTRFSDKEEYGMAKRGARRGPRREGGFGDRRDDRGGHGDSRPRREGGFGGQRREGGFGSGRREGGFGSRREGGGGFGGSRREGGFGSGRREGGYGGPRREGGFGDRRDDRGGYGDSRPRREGGFGGPRREGGFGGPRREGGGGFGGPRREGGFGSGRREGGYGGSRREGSFGDRRDDRGGYGDSRPRREGGFGGPRREGGGFGGPRREGGFSSGRKEGGYGGSRREGSFGDRRGDRGGYGDSRPRREGGGFGGPRRDGGKRY